MFGEGRRSGPEEAGGARVEVAAELRRGAGDAGRRLVGRGPRRRGNEEGGDDPPQRVLVQESEKRAGRRARQGQSRKAAGGDRQDRAGIGWRPSWLPAPRFPINKWFSLLTVAERVDRLGNGGLPLQLRQGRDRIATTGDVLPHYRQGCDDSGEGQMPIQRQGVPVDPQVATRDATWRGSATARSRSSNRNANHSERPIARRDKTCSPSSRAAQR